MTSALCATCGHRIYSAGLARWAHAMTPEHEHEAAPDPHEGHETMPTAARRVCLECGTA